MAERAPAHVPPQLAYQAAIMRRSLDALGRRWTLLILRDVGFLRLRRFAQIQRNNPGLTPRVLSRRLKEMVADGLLSREGAGLDVRYAATSKGDDALFVLFAFLRYGLRHFPEALAGVGPRPRQGDTP